MAKKRKLARKGQQVIVYIWGEKYYAVGGARGYFRKLKPYAEVMRTDLRKHHTKSDRRKR